MITSSPRETRHLFKMEDICWMGARITLFEPSSPKRVYHIPVLETEDPFAPLAAERSLNAAVISYVLSAAGEGTYAFSFICNDLRYAKVHLSQRCGARMCNGSHDESVPFPALTSTSTMVNILSGVVRSESGS